MRRVNRPWLNRTEISYWKSNGVALTYQSAYTAWTIGGSGIHIYGGGTYNGSGDSEFPFLLNFEYH